MFVAILLKEMCSLFMAILLKKCVHCYFIEEMFIPNFKEMFGLCMYARVV